MNTEIMGGTHVLFSPKIGAKLKRVIIHKIHGNYKNISNRFYLKKYHGFVSFHGQSFILKLIGNLILLKELI